MIKTQIIGVETSNVPGQIIGVILRGVTKEKIKEMIEKYEVVLIKRQVV